MSSTLVLPDGIRLPLRSELKGPRAERDRLWAQVERASLHQGFVIHPSGTAEFACYVEVNVDANRLWDLFVALSVAVLGEGRARGGLLGRAAAADAQDDPSERAAGGADDAADGALLDVVDYGANGSFVCQLLLSDSEEELSPVVTAPLGRILPLLEEIEYQLAHDGWIQFGLVKESEGRVSGVLVTPTKHLQVWAQDPEGVVAVLRARGLEENSDLEFLGSFPVVVEPPENGSGDLLGPEDLRAALREEIGRD